MHDSSTCEVCRGLPIQGSLSDDEFLAFLASCRKELAAKQEIFEHRIQAASRWFYDMADLTLAIDDLLFGITPIGTHSETNHSWLWRGPMKTFQRSRAQHLDGSRRCTL
jgi:hypothetical protein